MTNNLLEMIRRAEGDRTLEANFSKIPFKNMALNDLRVVLAIFANPIVDLPLKARQDKLDTIGIDNPTFKETLLLLTKTCNILDWDKTKDALNSLKGVYAKLNTGDKETVDNLFKIDNGPGYDTFAAAIRQERHGRCAYQYD